MIEALGHYKILESVGPGTLGDVYRARDTRAGRTVAITVVGPRIAANPELRGRFLQDARAAVAVSHPNIVALYEIGEEDGRVYLVHEFMQGQTLKTIIGGRPLNPRRAVDLAGQIAEAIADAHASELVHGHITVDTIVVTPKGNAKIADFGLASWSAGEGGGGGRNPDGYRADLFSLGVILFEMLTGSAPAPGAGVPSAVNRLLPREFDPLVGRALDKSGGYETAVTLAAELRALGAILDVRMEASDASPLAMAGPKRARSAGKEQVAVWMAAALALGALAAAAWWYFRGA